MTLNIEKRFFRRSFWIILLQWACVVGIWGLGVGWLRSGYLDSAGFVWLYVGSILCLMTVMGYLFFHWFFEVWNLDDQDVVWTRGALHPVHTYFGLSELVYGRVKQSWLGKIFRFGTLMLVFRDASKKERVLHIVQVHQPRRVLRELQSQPLEKVQKFLGRFEVGTLCYKNEAGNPSSALVEFSLSDQGTLYVGTCRDFRKYRSLCAHPEVSFCCGLGARGVVHVDGNAVECDPKNMHVAHKEQLASHLKKRKNFGINTEFAYFEIFPRSYKLYEVEGDETVPTIFYLSSQ